MINVGVVGGSGYTGLELVKMLIEHPYFKLNYVATTSGDAKLEKLHPSLQDVVSMDVQGASVDGVKEHCDLVFLALPHKTSMSFAKGLLDAGVKVVDLSADYRLKKDNYEAFYCPHIDEDNLKNSVYGLPEYFREEIKDAKLVANPGCYPTATLLGVLPFREYIDSSVFVDAKGGVSGAGKKVSETTHFVTIDENMFAYNPIKHRHSIEIKQFSGLNINFVPHLLPVTRGMLVSIYASLNKDIDAKELLQDRYKNELFVRVVDRPVNIKNTAGTNFCDIFVAQNGKDIFINTSIDNLLRGASSQAVVNANIMMGYDESLAIPKIAYIP